MESYQMNKVNKGQDVALLCAQVSCQDPQSSLTAYLHSGDLTGFSSLLAEISPLDDGQQLSLSDDQKQRPGLQTQMGRQISHSKQTTPVKSIYQTPIKSIYPLGEDHWLNLPLDSEGGFSLLQLAVSQPRVEFTQLLIRAGARADMYNDDLDQAPIHTAILGGHGEQHLVALMENPRNRADVNMGMQPGGQTAIHLAAERGLQTCLRLLLADSSAQVDIRDLAGGRTPLYLAAVNKHAECVKQLLEAGASTNIKSGGTRVDQLIKQNLPYFDIDKVVVRQRPRENTLELLVELLDKGDLPLFKSVVTFLSSDEISSKAVKGFTVLQRASAEGKSEFVSVLLSSGANPNLVTAQNPRRPVLLAAAAGHAEVLRVLVDQYKLKEPQGHLANLAVWARDSHETILHLILKKSHKKALAGISSQADLDRMEAKYAECLEVLTDTDTPDVVKSQLARVINKKDDRNNTALHYAAQLWSQEVVSQLLHLGANIGVANLRGEIPLARILPDTLEKFLDEGCTSHFSHPMNADFGVEFNYSFLAPPVDDYVADDWDEDMQEELEKVAKPETQSLWCMAQSKHHRHLLKHPVIASFLWLKWQRIRRVFNRNIRLYFMFVVSLTWYIFARFGGVKLNSEYGDRPVSVSEEVEKKEVVTFCQHLPFLGGGNSGFWYIIFCLHCLLLLFLTLRDLKRECGCSSLGQAILNLISSWLELLLTCLAGLVIVIGCGALYYVLTVLLILLGIRELFQMAAGLKRYWLSGENLLEVILIVLSGVMLFSPVVGEPQDCEKDRHIAAICLLLAWTELIILCAKHPRLSGYNVHIAMFYKVLKTFFVFLSWYSFFIIAFALSFYIMLHKDIPNFTPEKDHYIYFDSPWLALVKIVAMFVGELEFSDLPISSDSSFAWLSFSLLVCFIFLIVVVLMNLLNGLAVSDTGDIKQQAEIVSYISRVETIAHMETVLLGDSFNLHGGEWPGQSLTEKLPNCALCEKMYSCCPGAKSAGHALTGATGILLFYSLLPDKKAKFPRDGVDAPCSCCKVATVDDLPKDIMEAVRNLALKKEETERNPNLADFQSQIESAVLRQQSQIDRIEAQIQQLVLHLTSTNAKK